MAGISRYVRAATDRARYTPSPNPQTGAPGVNAITGLSGPPPAGFDPRNLIAQQMGQPAVGMSNPNPQPLPSPPTATPIAQRTPSPPRNYGDIAQMLSFVQGQGGGPNNGMPAAPGQFPQPPRGAPPMKIPTVPRAVM